MARPFQFSLRSMFRVVAVVAVLCLIGPPVVARIWGGTPEVWLMLAGGVGLSLAGANDNRASGVRQMMRFAGVLAILYALALLFLGGKK